MPSEHTLPPAHDQGQADLPQSQIKYCSACHSSLANDQPLSPFLLQPAQDTIDNAAMICHACGSCVLPTRIDPRDGSFLQGDLLRSWTAALHDGNNEAIERHTRPVHDHTHSSHDQTLDDEMGIEASSPILSTPLSSRPDALRANSPATSSDISSHSVDSTPASLSIVTSHLTPPYSTHSPHALAPSPSSPFASSSKLRSRPISPPDPLIDITRLRVRSRGHHCLYPGASFQGTQKSGRNSYDVNVTIVDVDFSSSHLCGYLRIRGLTDDWPELTTYFDAEIIGSRYGFLTRNWGASEQEDMVHWGRFPAFRHVRSELRKPHLTMGDADRGAVFMRWKEKFLVPDHRVQDINGASFAGFYYVCVDFNPQHTGSLGSQASQHLPHPTMPACPEDVIPSSSVNSSSLVKPELSPRARRESVNRGAQRLGRSSSSSRSAPSSNVATMSGFYFHQNSEPYQQLSLVHVPEHTSSCFEFR
ncbi:hypothetical protein QCA50_003106 [Cerrena zonata]|uniref:Vacuolar import and degradation protein-domain-containing protein n=1 Tax=Cerrena zonata TaxID=2478898 RepID=A0AAW0GU76_9APHY